MPEQAAPGNILGCIDYNNVLVSLGRDSESGGTIKQIARDEVRNKLKDGRVIKLDTPKYLYEAVLLNGNKVGIIVVTPEGQVSEGPKWIVRPL